MTGKTIKISYEEYNSFDDLDAEGRRMVTAALEMLPHAYAPYSGFSVAAAVLLEDGEIICGTNQENAAYPSGLCAERVALFNAATRFPGTAPVALAIVATGDAQTVPSPASPCGACRQVMAETEYRYQKPLRVIFSAGENRFLSFNTIDKLLPVVFNGKNLGK